jgi:hypothetical protein
MKEKWIRCITCNKVTHVTQYDTFPHYHGDHYGEVSDEDHGDEGDEFMSQHEGHELEELSVVKDSFISEGRYGEPLKVGYYEAINGKERFVIKRWREDITAPLQYELIPGYIRTTHHFEVQSDEIRKQMREEIKNPPFDERKIDRFIQIVEEVVSRASPRDAIKVTEETDSPLVSYGRLGVTTIKEIIGLTEKMLDEREVRQVVQFIHHNNSYNEPMTLLIKKRFTIKKMRAAQPKAREVRQQVKGEVVQKLQR